MTTRPIRVAHLVATAGRSGVESHLRAALPAFDRREVEARLFVPGDGPLVEALRAQHVAVESGAPTHKWAYAEARALGRRLRGTCDVVHAHGPRVAFWAATVAREAQARALVITLHELRWLSLPPSPRRWLWTALEDAANARADRLVVLSSDAHARVLARHPAWRDRMVLAPGTTPLLAEPAATPSPTPHAGPLRLVSVGRLHWVKGHDALLRAVADVRGRGVEVTLTLVGDGPLEASLRAQARSLGLADVVRWHGGAFEPARVLPEHDLFVAASHTETQGIAALEAMACGLPVLAPDLGGFRDLVVDGVTGMLVPGREDAAWPQALAHAIERMAHDRETRDRMGRAGRERAHARFAPRSAAAALAAVYRALLASSNPSAR